MRCLEPVGTKGNRSHAAYSLSKTQNQLALPMYHSSFYIMMERVQTGVRLEEKLGKVLKTLTEYRYLS